MSLDKYRCLKCGAKYSRFEAHVCAEIVRDEPMPISLPVMKVEIKKRRGRPPKARE